MLMTRASLRTSSVLAGCLAVVACSSPRGRAEEPASARQPTASPDSIEVMVLGTYHMANPGHDVVNTEVDDVTSPRRQRELADLSGRLARFRPTRILVERQAPGPSFALAAYGSYTPALLATDRNEIVQVGFRLARELGHTAVYGFDEDPGPGEPDYFPIAEVKAYAEAHGRAAWYGGLLERIEAIVAELTHAQPRHTIPELLAMQNDPAKLDRIHRLVHYEYLKLGDDHAQPGAELNAMWYLRNAKMFSKLTLIAQPGDRVLVLVGAGHLYWLRHFVEGTPGFRLADPRPYLLNAT
jgi:hypothetical protein